MNKKPTLMKQKLSLTGILIRDEQAGGYTAALAEFPEAIAEGRTPEEAEKNLFEAFLTIIQYRKDEFMAEMKSSNDDNITTRPFELELA